MPKAEMKKNLEQILSYKEMRFSILYFSSELPEFQHTHTHKALAHFSFNTCTRLMLNCYFTKEQQGFTHLLQQLFGNINIFQAPVSCFHSCQDSLSIQSVNHEIRVALLLLWFSCQLHCMYFPLQRLSIPYTTNKLFMFHPFLCLRKPSFCTFFSKP